LKKAELLKQKVGKITTLEAAAAALGGKQIEVIDSVRLNSSSKIAYEPKIGGAAFNPANKGKVVPEVLEGQSGIYVVRIDSVGTTPVTVGDIAEQRNNRVQQMKQYVSNPQSPANPLSVLKNAATINDKRSRRY
jgi:peptidyl-prolyl cis-trans isomerase D